MENGGFYLLNRLESMKRHGNLWEKITSEENITLAYLKAKKHKSQFRAVKKFELNEENNLKRIRASLINKTFTTAKYFEKQIYEPKKRIIYVLPFTPDRIVQHALMNILIPIMEGLFIDDSYACREGKGLHKGSLRTMEYVRRNRYCLKCDIAKFYPSVNHEILLKIIKRKIKCKNTLWLIEDIINSFPGEFNVPIGNFTSQWFGNLYMNELDKFVKEELKIKDYLRYCDDFCLFHKDKKVLNEARAKIKEFIETKLKLRFSKCDLFQTAQGVDFLGYRHFRKYILLRKSTTKRVKKRLSKLPKQLEENKITKEQYRSSIASTIGWIKWANTHNLGLALNIRQLQEVVNA